MSRQKKQRVLSENTPLFFTSLSVLDMAQGLPLGFLGIVLPAWLAKQIT